MPIFTRGSGGLFLPALSNPATSADIAWGKKAYDAKGKLITGTRILPLNECSWQQISEIAAAGLGPAYWKVGDTKTIVINGAVGNTTFTDLVIEVFILGFDHNSSLEGSNRIHFQIGQLSGKLVGLIDGNYGSSGRSSSYFQMNATSTNSGGWAGSSMRKTLLGNDGTLSSPPSGSLLAALPADLRAVMKSCRKYSDNTGGGSDTASYVTATTDYLFLLAEFEYQGARSFANGAEKSYQAQYDYYKAGYSKVHYMHNATGNVAVAWCRSAGLSISDKFCLVGMGGRADLGSAGWSSALAPGFCV